MLDVLTTEQIDAVCRTVIENQVPALFSLTVTGALRISPADPYDELIHDAFNDHQRRAGRAGPDAATLVVNALCTGGFTVRTQETPWRLTASSDWAFVEQLLQERLDAAVAQNPSLGSANTGWFELRRSQYVLGILGIEVEHRDVLALPGRWFASRRKVEDRADVGAQAEPPYRSGNGVREQIGAREPYAGNPISNQERGSRQVEPVEYTRGQEI